MTEDINNEDLTPDSSEAHSTSEEYYTSEEDYNSEEDWTSEEDSSRGEWTIERFYDSSVVFSRRRERIS